MPALPINGLPPVTDVFMADQFAIDPASGPPTSSCTKQQILTGATGEELDITGESGDVIAMLVGGGIQITLSAGASLNVLGPPGQDFGFDASGFGATAVRILFLTTDGSQVDMSVGNPIRIISPFGVICDPDITTSPGDWAGAPPSTQQQFDDRVAAAVRGLLGGPIP